MQGNLASSRGAVLLHEAVRTALPGTIHNLC